MSAGIYNMRIEQGASFELLLTLKDSLGASIDLTGRTFEGELKKTSSDVAVAAVFSFEILDQTIVPNLGKVKVKMSAATTTAIVVPTLKTPARHELVCIYDIKMLLPGGEVDRVLQGTATVSGAIT